MRSDVQREYGGALWSLASDEGIADAVLDDLQMICDVLQADPQYLRLICAPNIPLEERLTLLDDAFRGHVHPYVLNFMKLLTERRHFGVLPECIAEYRKHYDDANEIENVTVISAVPLSPEQKKALGRKLSETRRKNIHLTAKVDPSLIGGIRVETESAAFDGSVRGRIETIRESLHQTTI